jgi:hypothetical protein
MLTAKKASGTAGSSWVNAPRNSSLKEALKAGSVIALYEREAQERAKSKASKSTKRG